MPRFTNRDRSTDKSGDLCTQNEALVIMGVITVVVGLFIALPATWYLLKAVAWDFGRVFLTVWVVGAAVRFWASKMYEQGMTWKEVLSLFFWPIDLGARILYQMTGKQQVGNYSEWLNDGRGFRIPRLPSIIVLGGGLSLLAASMLIDSLFVALVLTLEIAALAFFSYILVALAQFWIAQAWRDGMTRQELDDMLFWIAS